MLTADSVGTTRVDENGLCRAACRTPVPSALALLVRPASSCREFSLRGAHCQPEDHLDNQQATAGFHGATTVTEDREALCLAPIVNDVREQIGVASAGNMLKETAGLDHDPVFHSAGLDQRRCVAHDMREVVEDTSTPECLLRMVVKRFPVA